MKALAAVDTWPVEHAAALAVTPAGTALHGVTEHRFWLASVTKPIVVYAVLMGVEEGAVGLDDPVGPPGSTLRHLLAHTSGYGFDRQTLALARPGTRRIYSSVGIEEATAHLERATGMPFAEYLHEAVFEPLGMGASALEGSPGSDVWSTAEDLARFAAEVLHPTLLHDETVQEMCTVQFPGLSGVLPGHGRYDPLDWGLGFEMNFGRPGHWGGQLLSRRAAGHFGAGGTFLWVDRSRGLAAAALTDREFEQWAREAWPELNDAIVRESGADGDASST